MNFDEKHKQIFTVGLTGGIGAGKSTVGRIFETLGIPRFDADKYAHMVYQNDSSVRESVIGRFGLDVGVLGEDGLSVDINKQALGSLVFTDPEGLEFLNKLVHPVVRQGFISWAEILPPNTPFAIREAAILFESGADEGCDVVISVNASEDVRTKRVMLRDGLSESKVIERMEMQLSDEERANRSDFTIFNNPKDLVLEQVIEIHQEICKKVNEEKD
mgnify:CR=1 FL=1|tara:strand:+ start:176 stop:826 length:651 start_codon:yes stop_codon:yes gene_type:complete